jgi:hypothetical protein
LQDYIPIIDDWLEIDKKQPRKQRHTMTRIFHRLQEERAYGVTLFMRIASNMCEACWNWR